MIIERKSKYKHKIIVSEKHSASTNDMIRWCEETFGPGGRKHNWRFGWMQRDHTFYFKNGQDATVFAMKWI